VSDLIYDFDITGLDPERTVVKCATQEDADIFLRYLVESCVYMADEAAFLSRHWRSHGSSTCYHLSQQRWCNENFYRLKTNFAIVNFADIYKPRKAPEITYGYDDLFEWRKQ
jgi:hypothetical protein